MKIKIIKCIRPDCWYTDRIGEEFELDYVSLNEDTQNYDAYLTYNKTLGSRYFVFNGDYEFISDNASFENLLKRIEKIEQQINELQNRQLPPANAVHSCISPYSPWYPYPTITWISK